MTNPLVMPIIRMTMFIRVKKFDKREYYYLVEGYREGGKVKQRVIKYLGKEKPTPGELEEIIKGIKGWREGK